MTTEPNEVSKKQEMTKEDFSTLAQTSDQDSSPSSDQMSGAVPHTSTSTDHNNQEQDLNLPLTGAKRAAPLTTSSQDDDDNKCSKKKSRTLVSTAESGGKGGEDEEEAVDTATVFGYKDGDRLEVEWDIEGDGAEGTKVDTHWWGATLLPFDGRIKDQVAIRTLEYDAYPQGGFPEKSKEDVVFLDHNVLADPENMDQVLYYRRAGSEETYGIDSVEPVVNQILQNVLAKNQQAWNHLTPAQQAHIASKIAAKKQKLVDLLQQQTGLVTSQEMQAILAQTMNE
ncbi:hypothetical protein ACA910_012038 [Epithemia clementina (nom. ined.)]